MRISKYHIKVLLVIDFLLLELKGLSPQSSPNYASVNTLQAPSVASGLQARRGFEGYISLAADRRDDVGGRVREMEVLMIGVKLQTSSQK